MRYVLNNYVCKLEWAIEEFWGFNATLSVEIMLRVCKTKYILIEMIALTFPKKAIDKLCSKYHYGRCLL